MGQTVKVRNLYPPKTRVNEPCSYCLKDTGYPVYKFSKGGPVHYRCFWRRSKAPGGRVKNYTKLTGSKIIHD